MHDSVHAFASRALASRWLVEGSRVLEVGSYDVNGSVRAYVESLGCALYLGVDACPGPGVDVVRDACVPGLCESVGGPFDLVVCTEMLEHAENWRVAVENIKSCVRPGGRLLLTTRSHGFPLHEYPGDYWRFELDDLRRIFDDYALFALESDPESPGVFLLASPIEGFPSSDLSVITLRSMHLNIVTWKWGSLFGPEYVNRLCSMFARHLHIPHRFLCVTDDPTGVDDDVEIVVPGVDFDDALSLWRDPVASWSPCLPRLKQYDAAMARVFGRRFLSIDLDLVLVDDVTPLFDRPDPLALVNWTYTGGDVYGGGIVLMDAGVLHGMWDVYRADPAGYGEVSRGADSLWRAQGRRAVAMSKLTSLSPRERRSSRLASRQALAPPPRPFGMPSDQCVLNHYLHTNPVEFGTWTEADGIVRYFTGSRSAFGPPLKTVPEGVRMVVFGHDDKAVMDQYQHQWIKENWR